MPKDVSKRADTHASAAIDHRTSKPGPGTRKHRRGQEPHMHHRSHRQPEPEPEPKSFDEIREFVDIAAKELTFYHNSGIGKLKLKKRVEEIQDNIMTLGNEYRRLARRKTRLHELVYEAGKNGWAPFLQDQVKVDKTIKAMKDMLWDQADEEYLQRVLDFIQRSKWADREIKYVQEHPTCFSCQYRNKLCTFRPKVRGGGTGCTQCRSEGVDGRNRGSRCPRQTDYWTGLMVKATGRPEDVLKEMIAKRPRFRSSRVFDVDSTFGYGQPLHRSPRKGWRLEINNDITVDLVKIGADLQQLSANGKEALQKISAAGQRLHREMIKKEGSIRALVLVAHRNIDNPRMKTIVSKAPPRRSFVDKT